MKNTLDRELPPGWKCIEMILTTIEITFGKQKT